MWDGKGGDDGRGTFSIAARIAGGGELNSATAGKPDCYRGVSQVDVEVRTTGGKGAKIKPRKNKRAIQ